MIQVLIEHQNLFLKGFLTTIELLALIMIIGIPLGVLFGIIGARYSVIVAGIINSLRFLTKVIPVLVLLFWLHFPAQALLGVVIDPFWTTVLALSFINTIATAYLIQEELKLLPKAYADSARGLGLNKRQIAQHIEIPILFRRVASHLLLNQAAMLEYTLLASLISVQELFRVAQTINATIYDPISVYSLLVFFFVIILVPLHLAALYFSKKYKIVYV